MYYPIHHHPFAAYNKSGVKLGSHVITLGHLQHVAANIGPMLGIQTFIEFGKITSTLPIVSRSLDGPSFPRVLFVPPGDLPASTTLVP